MPTAEEIFAERKATWKFRPTAWRYRRRDPWVIGYGHREGVQEGDTCTIEQADAFLWEDVLAAMTP